MRISIFLCTPSVIRYCTQAFLSSFEIIIKSIASHLLSSFAFISMDSHFGALRDVRRVVKSGNSELSLDVRVQDSLEVEFLFFIPFELNAAAHLVGCFGCCREAT